MRQEVAFMMTGWNYSSHMTTWGWIWMSVGMAVVIVALVAVVVLILRAFSTSRGSAGAQQPSALDMLSQRYAAGELDDDEFERRRSKLGS